MTPWLGYDKLLGDPGERAGVPKSPSCSSPDTTWITKGTWRSEKVKELSRRLQLEVNNSSTLLVPWRVGQLLCRTCNTPQSGTGERSAERSAFAQCAELLLSTTPKPEVLFLLIIPFSSLNWLTVKLCTCSPRLLQQWPEATGKEYFERGLYSSLIEAWEVVIVSLREASILWQCFDFTS